MLAAGRVAAGRDGSRRPSALSKRRLCGLPDRLPPSRAVALRCGLRTPRRGDARHVQKDEEASPAWVLKDEIVRRGQVYYAQARARQGHVRRAADDPLLSRGLGRAPVRRRAAPEPPRPGTPEGASSRVGDEPRSDLRDDIRRDTIARRSPRHRRAAGGDARRPSAVVYRPFTYIWTLAVGRFPEALRRRDARPTAAREIARCFLAGAGMTVPR